MRDCQYNQSENEIARAAKRDIESSADDEGNSDRGLHAPRNIPSQATGGNWSHRSADSAGREQDPDAGGRASSHRKDLLAKHGQQSKYAAAHAPRGLDQQQRQHSRPLLDVTDAFNGVGNSQGFGNSDFAFL